MEENEKLDSQKAIEIRSEEMDEILGRKPNKLIRYGITIIFFVIAIILSGSYFFKYPDIITAPLKVTAENLPINLVAKTTGKIHQLLVRDNQKVMAGDVLAIIENPACYEDVMRLRGKLDTLKYCFYQRSFRTSKALDSVKFDAALYLGELQIDYIGFLKALSDFNLFVEADFQHKKIASLREQKQKHYVLQQKIIRQSRLSREQLDLTQQQFVRDSGLLQGNAIAPVELEKSKSTLLQSKSAWENSRTSIDNSELTIAQLEQNILELEQEYEEQYKQLFNALSNSYQTLINQIRTWEQTWLLITPIDGRVTFTKFWSVNQDVVANDNVFSIVPDEPARITGKIEMPVAGSGKVKVGQKVNIKLENFPYMEYGVLVGKVQRISLIPIDNNYYVEVELPNGLRTNYDRELPFSGQLQGTAEVVTDDLRLIERFLSPLRSVWKKSIE